MAKKAHELKSIVHPSRKRKGLFPLHVSEAAGKLGVSTQTLRKTYDELFGNNGIRGKRGANLSPINAGERLITKEHYEELKKYLPSHSNAKWMAMIMGITPAQLYSLLNDMRKANEDISDFIRILIGRPEKIHYYFKGTIEELDHLGAAWEKYRKFDRNRDLEMAYRNGIDTDNHNFTRLQKSDISLSKLKGMLEIIRKMEEMVAYFKGIISPPNFSEIFKAINELTVPNSGKSRK